METPASRPARQATNHLESNFGKRVADCEGWPKRDEKLASTKMRLCVRQLAARLPTRSAVCQLADGAYAAVRAARRSPRRTAPIFDPRYPSRLPLTHEARCAHVRM